MCRTELGLPWSLSGKEFTCKAGDPGSIRGSGRSPGGGHSYTLQYSCLENPMGRGAWWLTNCGVSKIRTWQVPEHTHRTELLKKIFQPPSEHYWICQPETWVVVILTFSPPVSGPQFLWNAAICLHPHCCNRQPLLLSGLPAQSHFLSGHVL